MTRALSSRSSKRNQAKSSQEVVPRDCKENSPLLSSQPMVNKLSANIKRQRKPLTSRQEISSQESKDEPTVNKLSDNKVQRKSARSKCEAISQDSGENSSSSQTVVTQLSADKYQTDDKENRITNEITTSQEWRENSPLLPSRPMFNKLANNKRQRKPVTSSQQISSQESENSPLNKSSANNMSNYRTQRKSAKSKCEVISQDSKINSPLSQTMVKKNSANNTLLSEDKENIIPTGITKSKFSNGNKECYSPIRRSVRRLNTSLINKIEPLKAKAGENVLHERSVLSDKTNSPRIRGNCCDMLRSAENKIISEHKLSCTPKSSPSANSSYTNKPKIGNHVPVYKIPDSLGVANQSKDKPPEEKEAIYEFEVDENEDPAPKKKRKKRAYVRKPKIGPKALTINNIKYSSSESLVSLPEKPVRQKKKMTERTKSDLKSYSSVSNLNNSEDTCSSVKSFMSHPPSLLLCDNRKDKCKMGLSVLQETRSEECQTPNQLKLVKSVKKIALEVEPPHHDSHISLISEVNPLRSVTDGPSTSHDVHFSPNPRCYASKRDHSAGSNIDLHDTLPNQMSSCSTDISRVSSRDFLSSTPCKPVSIVYRNSVFEETDDVDIIPPVRQSTGFIKSAAEEANVTLENCFGFDEPEELEEPLVSPIKNNTHEVVKKTVKLCLPKFQLNDMDEFEPDIQEVIKILKSTVPQAPAKEPSSVFDSSPRSSNSSSPGNTTSTIDTVKFKKPPRRSYERQRRVRHGSEHEEDSEKSDEEEGKKVKKVVKNCYKKTNTTKTARAPRVTKAKKRIAKEEEEIEKLAAEMNAKFQEIEKVNLVVE